MTQPVDLLMEPVELALVVATKYPVHALDAEKHPVTEHGFKDATRDPEVVRAQFSHPRAALVGVPTGATSGLFVLDIDPQGEDWLAENRERLPATRSHRTRRGMHLIYAMPEGFVPSTRNKVAPGVDVRADGGYAVWWPAAGLPVEHAETITAAPDWLIETARGGRAPAAPVADNPFGAITLRTNVSLAQTDKLFAFLKFDDYDEWVLAGMAAHHEHGGDGFAVWDAHSITSSKYPGAGEARRKWESFGRYRGKPVSMRNVFKLAGERGAPKELWTGAATTSAPVDVLALVAAPPAGTERRRFPISPLAEFVRGAPPSWLIKGIIPRAVLGIIYAEPGAGKSFVALDMGLHLAAARPWRCFATKQARVAYVVAEGSGGFKARAAAEVSYLGVAPADIVFDVIPCAPNLLDPAQVADLIAQLKERGGYDVIFVDTLAQVTPGGNENTAEDMGLALAHCRALHEATGATVILVHHAGKDPTKGARGWSGLRAAADFEIEITRTGDDREMRITKQKDGEDGAVMPFRLVKVPTELLDEDGLAVMSCYVQHVDRSQQPRKVPPPKGAIERAVHDALVELSPPDITNTDGVPVGELIDAAAPRIEHDPATRDRRRFRAMRALEAMKERGTVAVQDQFVRLAHGT